MQSASTRMHFDSVVASPCVTELELLSPCSPSFSSSSTAPHSKRRKDHHYPSARRPTCGFATRMTCLGLFLTTSTTTDQLLFVSGNNSATSSSSNKATPSPPKVGVRRQARSPQSFVVEVTAQKLDDDDKSSSSEETSAEAAALAARNTKRAAWRAKSRGKKQDSAETDEDNDRVVQHDVIPEMDKDYAEKHGTDPESAIRAATDNLVESSELAYQKQQNKKKQEKKMQSENERTRLPVLLGTGKKLFECKIPPPIGDDMERIYSLAKAKLAVLEHVCVKLPDTKEDADKIHSVDSEYDLCFERGEALLRPRAALLNPNVGHTPQHTKQQQELIPSDQIVLARDNKKEDHENSSSATSSSNTPHDTTILSLRKRMWLIRSLIEGKDYEQEDVDKKLQKVRTEMDEMSREQGIITTPDDEQLANRNTDAVTAQNSRNATDRNSAPDSPSSASSENSNVMVTAAYQPKQASSLIYQEETGYYVPKPEKPPKYPAEYGKKRKTDFVPDIAVAIHFLNGKKKITCECARPTEETIRFLVDVDTVTGLGEKKLLLAKAVSPDRIVSPACCSFKGKPAPEDLLWPLLHSQDFCSRYQPQQYKQLSGITDSELYTRSWWTTEFCLGAITQFHVTKSGQAHGSRIGLGYLKPADLTMTNNALLQTVEGGTCSSQFQVFTLSAKWLEQQVPVNDDDSADEHLRGYGGTFNPLHVEGFEGRLVQNEADKNVYGCNEYKQKVEPGSIMVVKRGNCWFHEKALRAQNAGARGVIIANDDRPMADIMEGVDTLPAPHIMSVLVNQQLGKKLLENAKGSPFVKVKKHVDDEVQTKSLTTFVTLYCSSEWDQPVCPKGTTVEIFMDDTWKRGVVEKELPDLNHLLIVHGKQAAVEKIVHRNSVHRLPDFMPCTPSPVRVEFVEEPKNCQSNIKVHVASLCGHNSLLPQQKTKTEKIRCGLPDTSNQLVHYLNRVGRRLSDPEDGGEKKTREEL
ncbi:unnamed protein product [Amoebophrya sp. A120]|nr:unnamed protein product [Amoebophrya sp. A120]|eukprot:GSA120T00008946001.1